MARRRVRVFRQTLALLAPHAVGEGSRLIAGALLGAAVVALHVVQPWPLKWILDYLSGATWPRAMPSWIVVPPMGGVTALCALFVAITVASALAEYGQIMLLNGLGNRVMYRFRAALFTHLLRLPLSFHESREVGELLTRVIYDTSRLRRGINGSLIRVFQTLFLFLAILAVLVWLHPGLGVVFGVGGALALLTMRRRGRRIARAARQRRKKEGALAGLLAGELMGVRELQAFAVTASPAERRFGRRNDRSLKQEQKVRRLAAGLTFRVETLVAVTIAVALWLGTRAVLSGGLTVGDLVVFFSYALALRAPFARFAYETARLGRAAACADRLVRLATRQPAITDGPHAVAAPPVRGDIVFDDVAVKAAKRRRGGRKWTLDGLTCRLPAGKRTAIVGANGAGKSTLLSLVLRLAEPSRGRVLIDGAELRAWSVDSLRRQMSVVFQNGVLTGLTVRENIAFGMPEADQAAVEAAAAAARADALIARLRHGLDTPVRRGGGLFSGGERQRLAVARALLRDGRIWLLDEPATGLDLATTAELTTLLLNVTRDRTTLWVTHDPSLLAQLDYVVALEEGRAVFTGPPDEYRAWCARRPGPGAAPRQPERESCAP